MSDGVPVLLGNHPGSERLNGQGECVEGSIIRVLVVDDFEPWRRSTLAMLQEHPGLRVAGEVSDGLEAVRQAQELQVDLILLDIGLPTLNGIAAARKIRKLSPQSKILFVSQESSPEVVEEALSTGEGYVLKTEAGRELLTAVNAVLRGEGFVSSKFAGHGFPETSSGQVPEGIASKNVSASLEQDKKIVHRHEVVFYSDDQSFLDDLAEFIECALKAGNAAIAVANESHRNSLRLKLEASGLNIAAAAEQGRYIALDAADTVSTFVVDGTPDAVRLLHGFGNLLLAAGKAAKGEHPRVVAAGQIAPLLWAQGDAEAAIQVEKLTNHLVKTYDVEILCGYPRNSFESDVGRSVFQQICAEHSCVYFR
jgi:DNA-binding NarL/FixJ family response regulator